MKYSEGEETKVELGGLIWDEKSKEFGALLKDVYTKLKLNPGDAHRVASLGCGLFLEAGALVNFFPNAKVEGFDAKTHALLTKNSPILLRDVDIIVGDLRQEEIFNNREHYDVLVVRNPDIHREDNWVRIFKNGVNHLKDDGVVVITCATDYEQDRVEHVLEGLDLEVKLSEILNNTSDNPSYSIFKDRVILVAQKK